MRKPLVRLIVAICLIFPALAGAQEKMKPFWVIAGKVRNLAFFDSPLVSSAPSLTSFTAGDQSSEKSIEFRLKEAEGKKVVEYTFKQMTKVGGEPFRSTSEGSFELRDKVAGDYSFTIHDLDENHKVVKVSCKVTIRDFAAEELGKAAKEK